MGLLARRIVPNALTPLIVQGTLGIGGAVLEVAALSFLGLGIQPPDAEWGSMIGAERKAAVRLRDEGEIGDEVLRRVQRDLDLETMLLEAGEEGAPPSPYDTR